MDIKFDVQCREGLSAIFVVNLEVSQLYTATCTKILHQLRSNLIFFCSPVIFFLREKGIYPLNSVIQQLEPGVYGVNILPI